MVFAHLNVDAGMRQNSKQGQTAHLLTLKVPLTQVDVHLKMSEVNEKYFLRIVNHSQHTKPAHLRRFLRIQGFYFTSSFLNSRHKLIQPAVKINKLQIFTFPSAYSSRKFNIK